MAKTQTRSGIAAVLDMIGAAISAAAAEESGRPVKARDLRRLGIDPVAFHKIRRF
jgi:hypothetical protein